MIKSEAHNRLAAGPDKNTDTFWFGIVFFYLIVDLGFHQVLLSGHSLRLGLITTILLSFYLLTRSRDFDIVYRQSRHIIFFCCLLACYIPIAVNNYYAYLVFRNFALMLPFLFSCIILINSKSRFLTVCKVYGVLLTMASIYAISHQGTGPGGILNDENDLSLFLLVYMPLVLFVISQERALLKKILWIGSVLLIVVAIFFTKSRGGFVGLCAVAAAYWWCSKKKLKVLLIFFMVVFLGIAIGGNAYKDEITSITNLKENTARTRLLSWKAGFDMFVDNPLGVGGYNFSVLFPDYQPEEMNRNMWGRAAHSIWFTLLPETGVVGFVLYLSIIMMNIRDIKLLFRAVGDDFFHLLAISLSASFLGFFAAATFLSVLYYPYFWHLTLMLMISRKLVEFGSISDSDNTSPKTR